ASWRTLGPVTRSDRSHLYSLCRFFFIEPPIGVKKVSLIGDETPRCGSNKIIRGKSMIRFRNGQSVGIAIVLLACLSAVSLLGKTSTGRIIGTVTDPTGAVIPGVTITATNVETQVTTQTVTNEQGYYQVLLLPIGSYTVTAELPGFQKAVTK